MLGASVAVSHCAWVETAKGIARSRGRANGIFVDIEDSGGVACFVRGGGPIDCRPELNRLDGSLPWTRKRDRRLSPSLAQLGLSPARRARRGLSGLPARAPSQAWRPRGPAEGRG